MGAYPKPSSVVSSYAQASTTHIKYDVACTSSNNVTDVTSSLSRDALQKLWLHRLPLRLFAILRLCRLQHDKDGPSPQSPSRFAAYALILCFTQK